MKTFCDLAILVFVLSSVASIGLSLRLAEVFAPLKQLTLMARVLCVNFVVVPLLVVLISRVMALSEPLTAGMILLGAAAGAPFLPKLVEATFGDVASSVAVMVLLMFTSLIYLPLVLPLLLPGIVVDSLNIARSLTITMVLPLAAGMSLKAWRRNWAERVRPAVTIVSLISLVISLIAIPILNLQGFQELLSTWAIPACAVLIFLAFGAGFAMSGRTSRLRQATGLAAAARNIPAALLVGGQNFQHPHVVLMIVLSALISVVALVPVVLVCRRLNTNSTTADGSDRDQRDGDFNNTFAPVT